MSRLRAMTDRIDSMDSASPTLAADIVAELTSTMANLPLWSLIDNSRNQD